jgi:hypothetical protein
MVNGARVHSRFTYIDAWREQATLSIEKVNTRLATYGKAGETGDYESVTSLFSEDADYHEGPFEEPMRGHRTISHYTKTGASDSQDSRGRQDRPEVFATPWQLGMPN